MTKPGEQSPWKKNKLLQLLMPLWVAVLLLAHRHSHPAQKQTSSNLCQPSPPMSWVFVSPTSCLRLRNLRSHRPLFKKEHSLAWQNLRHHISTMLCMLRSPWPSQPKPKESKEAITSYNTSAYHQFLLQQSQFLCVSKSGGGRHRRAGRACISSR